MMAEENKISLDYHDFVYFSKAAFASTVEGEAPLVRNYEEKHYVCQSPPFFMLPKSQLALKGQEYLWRSLSAEDINCTEKPLQGYCIKLGAPSGLVLGGSDRVFLGMRGFPCFLLV